MSGNRIGDFQVSVKDPLTGRKRHPNLLPNCQFGAWGPGADAQSELSLNTWKPTGTQPRQTKNKPNTAPIHKIIDVGFSGRFGDTHVTLRGSAPNHQK